MKHVVVVTSKISSKQIKALEALGYKLTIVIK